MPSFKNKIEYVEAIWKELDDEEKIEMVAKWLGISAEELTDNEIPII